MAPVRRWRGSAADFHATPIGQPVTAEVWVFEVDRPAVVLGSSQPIASVDKTAAAAGGYELVRRRSGGGAVLLEPGDVVWFDVVVPAAVLRDHGVGDDVTGAMVWLGRLVAEALRAAGAGVDREADPSARTDLAVHVGPMIRTRWSPIVCFDGLGPGEIVRGGAKLVGISARRVRAATRFQCAVPTAWHPERLTELLAPPRPAPSALRPVATVSPAVAATVPVALAERLVRR